MPKYQLILSIWSTRPNQFNLSHPHAALDQTTSAQFQEDMIIMQKWMNTRIDRWTNTWKTLYSSNFVFDQKANLAKFLLITETKHDMICTTVESNPDMGLLVLQS